MVRGGVAGGVEVMEVEVGAGVEERLGELQEKALCLLSPVCKVGKELLRNVEVFSIVRGTGVGGRLIVLKAVGGLTGYGVGTGGLEVTLVSGD